MTGVGYIGVNTDDQAWEGISLHNQISKIRAYRQLKDLKLSEIIEDAGISAKNLKRSGVRNVATAAYGVFSVIQVIDIS